MEMQTAVAAIQSGDVEGLKQLLDRNRDLVHNRVDGQRTLLHVVTDWPGHRTNGAAMVAMLIERGADVNAAFIGKHPETPLHWAASCDDLAVLDMLLDHGADIEADGAVIAGGTPLADAVAFAQWNAARRLVERGAKVNLWQAAALGMVDEVSASDASVDEITKAFWCACHGGQRATAEVLLGRGAEIRWVGYDRLTPRGAAVRSGAVELAEWVREQGG